MNEARQAIAEPKELMQALKSGLTGRNVMVKYAGYLPPVVLQGEPTGVLCRIAELVATITAPSDAHLITAYYADHRDAAHCSLVLSLHVRCSAKGPGFTVTHTWADEFSRLRSQLLLVSVDVNVIQSEDCLEVEFEFPVYVHTASIPRHRDLIMVVEDDGLLREAIRAVLEFEGYRVIATCTAEEAIAQLTPLTEQLAVVVADITLPGMSGLEFARKIRETCSGVPVLLNSGYSHAFRSGGNDNIFFLAKPYDAKQLTSSIRDCMAANRRRTLPTLAVPALMGAATESL
jgi:CheY-like chemotaxis protein